MSMFLLLDLNEENVVHTSFIHVRCRRQFIQKIHLRYYVGEELLCKPCFSFVIDGKYVKENSKLYHKQTGILL